MDRSERILYHQIRPLKLAVDWITAFVSETDQPLMPPGFVARMKRSEIRG